MKYLEGCLGETRRRSTEPRLTLVSFKICSKLSFADFEKLNSRILAFIKKMIFEINRDTFFQFITHWCVYCVIDIRLQVTLVAQLMTEQDDFLSLLPLSPSLSKLLMEVVELNQVRGEPEYQSGPRKVHLWGKAKISAFNRRYSVLCAVQYYSLQGLRQCYVSLWKT